MKSKLLLSAAFLAILLTFTGCAQDDKDTSSVSEPISVVDKSVEGFSEVEGDEEKINDAMVIADNIAGDVLFNYYASGYFNGAIYMNDKYYYCYDYEYDTDFLGRIIIAVEDFNECYFTTDKESGKYVDLVQKHDSWFLDDKSDNRFQDEELNDLYRMAKIVAYDVLGSYDKVEKDDIVKIDGLECQAFTFSYESAEIGKIAIAPDYSKYFAYCKDDEKHDDYYQVARQYNFWTEYTGITYTDDYPEDDTYKNKAIAHIQEKVGEYTDVYYGFSFMYNDSHYFSYSFYKSGELLGVVAVSTDGGPDMIDYKNDANFELL